jgi:hypothetical protein
VKTREELYGTNQYQKALDKIKPPTYIICILDRQGLVGEEENL